jgi:predicted nucleotide-binding protein
MKDTGKVDKIDYLINRIAEGEKLSSIYYEAIIIAIDLEDYFSWAVLELNTSGVMTLKEEGAAIKEKFIKICQGRGVSNEQREKTLSDALNRYLLFRARPDGKVFTSSVSEIEMNISKFEESIKALNIPEGLHPVDLFYKNQSVEEQKFMFLDKIAEYKGFYQQLRQCLLSVLTDLHLEAKDKEMVMKVKDETEDSREVFIIHGHNEAKRRELEKILNNEFSLIPIVLVDLPSQGLTIIEKFEKHAKGCGYAFAIFTPDDIVEKNGEQYFQARPNVIFELGWFYARLGRSRVCILDQESEKSKIFSDLQGVLRVQFKDAISEVITTIREELKAANII